MAVYYIYIGCLLFFMPVTEDNKQEPIPNLKLAQLRFQASHGDQEASQELLQNIKEKSKQR